MSYKTHRKRPTSIANDMMFKAMQEKAYVTTDGQVLQSSMVKDGSPTKRQITGSASQVRFSLPPQDSDNDDDGGLSDEESFSFNEDEMVNREYGRNEGEDEDDEEDEENSFDDKPIFNLSTRELLKETPKKSSIKQSMVDIVENSPERHKLYIRPMSVLNDQQVPIPLELLLPPVLSPKNKRTSRPTSLIFNGSNYEPLEGTNPFFQSQSTPASPVSSIPMEKITISTADGQLPQLKKTLKPVTIDNEKEIANPSDAAKKLDNQLNKSFAFPPVNDDKSLPPIPQSTQKTVDNTKLSGLQIYTDNGQLQSLKPRESFDNSILSSASETSQPSSPLRSPIRFHHHKEVSQLPELPAQQQQQQQPSTPQRKLPNQNQTVNYHMAPSPQREVAQPASYNRPLHPQAHSQGVQDHLIMNRPAVYEQEKTVQPTQQNDEMVVSDDDYEDSIVSSLMGDETTQLLDLGNLIVSSSTALNQADKEIAAPVSNEDLISPITPSSTTEEQEVSKQQESSPVFRTLRPQEQPLGSQFQQTRIYHTDADQYRSLTKSKPLSSHSNYESEVSEPFSNTSSALTTATSVISNPVEYVDLTQDDMMLVKNKNQGSNNNNNRDYYDTFKTVLEEDNKGNIREVIVLDDDNVNDTTSKSQNNTPVGLPKSKSAMTRQEFESSSSSRVFSAFSFETVASEVQLNYKPSIDSLASSSFTSGSESASGSISRGYNMIDYPKAYTTGEKTVIELCDDTLKNTQKVMDELQRQKTIVINQQIALLKQKRAKENQLEGIKKLQHSLSLSQAGKKVTTPAVSTKENNGLQVQQLHQGKKQSNKGHVGKNDYFDYANGQSYNFQSFMNTELTR